MERDEFLEQLISQASLDAVDFACDLERVLADEVKYLRRVVAACGEENALEKDALIRELRARLADKESQIAHLLEENRFLRATVSRLQGA